VADAAGIVQFIERYLAEDEAMARKPWDVDWALGGNPGRLFVYFADEGSPAVLDCDDDGSAEYCVHFQPRRMLAEIAAKRRLLDIHRIITDVWTEDIGPTDDPYLDPQMMEPGATSGEGCVACHNVGLGNIAPDGPCETLKALAVPHVGREGWKDEWALAVP